MLAKLAKNVPSNELLDALDFIDTPGLELKGYDKSLLETRQGAFQKFVAGWHLTLDIH